MAVQKNSLWMLGAGAAMLTVLFIPQLFLGQAYSNGDAFFAFYPALSFYARQIAAHGSFLWSHAIVSGFPTYLDLVGGFYSPVTHLLFTYFSVITAYNLAIFLGTALLFLFSYLWARQIKVSREGSLLVAIAYSLGFHMAPWNNNITVVNAMFVLPMLLLCLAKIQERKYWWVLTGGVLAGYALISGQPQWVLLSFTGAGLYILFAIWPSLRRFEFSRSSLRLIVSLVIIAAFAFSISAFQILPSQRLAALSGRSEGLSFSVAQINSQTPFDWLWYLLPDLQFKYLNGQEPTLYIGILPLVFALFAFFKARKNDKNVQLATWLFAFGLLAAIKYSPLFWVIHNLPVFKFFRGSDRWMYIGNFGAAMLAGLGFDAMRADVSIKAISSIKRFIAWSLGIILAITAVANLLFVVFADRAAAFLYAYFDTHYYANTTHLPLEHYHHAIRSLLDDTFWNISFLNLRFVLALAFILAGYLFLRSIKGNLTRRQAILAVALSFLNLGLLNLNYYQIMPRHLAEDRPELASIVLASEHQMADVRYFTVLPGPAVNEILRSPRVGEVSKNDQVEFERGMLVVNVGMQYGIDTVDGYNNLMPRRNAQVLSVLGSERTNLPGLADKKENTGDKLKEIVSRLPLLSMLNVKYIVSAYELPATPSLSLVHTASVTRFNIPIYLYENKAVLPRVYLANNTVSIPKNEETAFNIITSPNDFSKITYLECADCQTNLPSPKDSLHINAYTDGLLDVTVDIANGRWLIFSESNLPGWDITIDGMPASSVTANYLFHGLYVPKGRHEVKWVYGGL